MEGNQRRSSEESDRTDANPRDSATAALSRRSVTAYLDPNYWDERFAGEEHYEWLKDYSHFQHLILRHLRPSHSVLELGCGNSRLCEGLLGDGVTDITCIDLSAIAVDRMRKRLRARGVKGIEVLEADMLDLPFGNESFDVVVEKGTMDVLFVDSGDPWKPRPETVEKVMAMLEGIHKVLKSDGTYISISFGQPHFRRPLFEAPGFTWSMECDTFGEGFHYFFYTLRKNCSQGKRLFESNGHAVNKLDVPSIDLLQEELEGEDYIFRTTVDELDN